MANNEMDRSRRRQAPREAAMIDPIPQSMPLFNFLLDLIESGFPERIALHACSGASGTRLSPVIKEITFKPSVPKPKREELITMSNGLIQAAQNDCDVLN